MDIFHMSDIIPLIGLPYPPYGRSNYNVPCPCCDDEPHHVHEAAHDQQDHVDDEQHHVLIRRDGEQTRRDHLGNAQVGNDPAERRGAGGKDQHRTNGADGTGERNIDILDGAGFFHDKGENERIDAGSGSRFRSGHPAEKHRADHDQHGAQRGERQPQSAEEILDA